jgi:hypothetical protein
MNADLLDGFNSGWSKPQSHTLIIEKKGDQNRSNLLF